MSVPLAIDGGRRAGWAIAVAGSPKPKAGVFELPENLAAWGGAWRAWIADRIPIYGITEIVLEAPIISDHGGSGVNFYEVEQAFTTLALIKDIAYQHSLPFSTAPRGTVCLHFTGTGKGKSKELKAACVAYCQLKGWGTSDFEVADALATLDWYCFKNNVSVGWNCQPSAGRLFQNPGVRLSDLPKASQAKVNAMANSAMRIAPK